MARGRKVKVNCNCGTIFKVSEVIGSEQVKLICPKCGKMKTVRKDKLPMDFYNETLEGVEDGHDEAHEAVTNDICEVDVD